MTKKKLKILIAPNSYKESADSVTAAESFYEYLKELDAEFIICPLSDGGDGFLKVISYIKEIETLHYTISAPWKYLSEEYTEEKLSVPIGYSKEEKTIYIESADILGMKIIPSEKRKPMQLTSEGLGELLLILKNEHLARAKEINKVVVGIGGTGTTDIGLGALSAMGLKLEDESGNSLKTIPENFNKASTAFFPKQNFPFKIELILDVNNELLGEQGGIRVYSPQKGIAQNEIETLESGVKNLLTLLSIKNQSGAGGGIAAGLSLISEVSNISSTQFFNDYLNLDRLISEADIIITGEGKFDKQSSFNKATGYILSQAGNKTIFLCCGIIKDMTLQGNIIPIELSKFFTSQANSIKNIQQAIKFASNIVTCQIKLH